MSDTQLSAEIAARGADVSEVWHGRGLGPHDPDGNSWLLQEITMRLPGRV